MPVDDDNDDDNTVAVVVVSIMKVVLEKDSGSGEA
jgi:hypothetical protein